MRNLIHVLGSDIPHHNVTLLRFFNDTLAEICPLEQIRHFMVVAKDSVYFPHYGSLDIERFDSKLALTNALIRRATVAQDEHYFLHGQFNPTLWIVMLTGKIHPSRISWHIWGADLYENSYRLCHRWFYLLRRRAQGCVGHVFATLGDLAFYRQYHPLVPTSLLYFPTRLVTDIARITPDKEDGRMTLLVGNSGDVSNRHSQALHAIYNHLGTDVHIIIQMSYPTRNDAYVTAVRIQAKRFFPEEHVQILTERLSFDDYLALLRQCDAGYFLFSRQQGIGTLSLMIQFGLPFVLNRRNPFCQDLLAQHVPILYEDDILNPDMIREMKQRMLALDPARIAFFYPNILQGWRDALSIAAGKSLL